MTDEQRRFIEENYPYMSGREVGEKVGMDRNWINTYARKHGLKHTPDTIKRIKEGRLHNLTHSRTKETYKKISGAFKKTYKMEVFRVLSGYKQKTKLKVCVLPKKTRRRITMLCHSYNYFKSDDLNSSTVYYDSETKRNAKAEEYAKEKYGIKFEEANG